MMVKSVLFRLVWMVNFWPLVVQIKLLKYGVLDQLKVLQIY